jgi:hypothetical protein
MKMAVMNIVDVTVMANHGMAAVGTMLVVVVGMMLVGAGDHGWFLLAMLSLCAIQSDNTASTAVRCALYQLQHVGIRERLEHLYLTSGRRSASLKLTSVRRGQSRRCDALPLAPRNSTAFGNPPSAAGTVMAICRPTGFVTP